MSITLGDAAAAAVGRVAMDRVDKRNALSAELREALSGALLAPSEVKSVRALGSVDFSEGVNTFRGKRLPRF